MANRKNNNSQSRLNPNAPEFCPRTFVFPIRSSNDLQHVTHGSGTSETQNVAQTSGISKPQNMAQASGPSEPQSFVQASGTSESPNVALSRDNGELQNMAQTSGTDESNPLGHASGTSEPQDFAQASGTSEPHKIAEANGCSKTQKVTYLRANRSESAFQNHNSKLGQLPTAIRTRQELMIHKSTPLSSRKDICTSRTSEDFGQSGNRKTYERHSHGAKKKVSDFDGSVSYPNQKNKGNNGRNMGRKSLEVNPLQAAKKYANFETAKTLGSVFDVQDSRVRPQFSEYRLPPDQDDQSANNLEGSGHADTTPHENYENMTVAEYWLSNLRESGRQKLIEKETADRITDSLERLGKMMNRHVRQDELEKLVEREELIISEIRSLVQRKQKLLIIMRGIPGSGKSYLAQKFLKLVREFENGKICCTDEYFMTDGTYDFNVDLLKEAHGRNCSNAEMAMEKGRSPVIIDNTNILEKEILPYVHLARTYKYKIKLVEPCTHWRYDVAVCCSLTPHGVPIDVIEKHLSRYLLEKVYEEDIRVENLKKMEINKVRLNELEALIEREALRISEIKSLVQRKQRLLIIMRGIPGSGKSYLAQKLLQLNRDNGKICCTDDYFIREDWYYFNGELLEEAHGWNRSNAEMAMEKGRNPVIIDNTNILLKREILPYVHLARTYKYEIKLVEPCTHWRYDAEKCFSLTPHGVPIDGIKRRLDLLHKENIVEEDLRGRL